MSAISSKSNMSFIEGSESRVNSSPGDKPLYFKNNGLFSENYLLNHLGKSKDPFLMRAWDTEGLSEFNVLYEWMMSTWADRHEEFETMKEAQLEEEWIRPILQRLGWEYIVQPDLTRHGKRQIPDYALYENSDVKKKAQKSDEQNLFNLCSVVSDAKAMSIDLDGKAHDNTNPSYQIMQYLTYTNKDWGILTNGRYWRVYSLKSKTKFRSYFEINVEKFLNGSTRDDERFKYFFNFFSRNAFAEKNAGNQSFIEIVFSEGEQYALQVETELKERAFDLVELIANGFASKNKVSTEKELTELYSHSLYYLFRLIFVLNCEAKGLLNISRQNDYFKYSLRHLCSQIKDEKEANQKWSSFSKSYDYIKMLFKMLSDGDEGIGIHGFGHEIFKGGIRKFFESNEIPDSSLNEVLLRLSSQQDKKKKTWSFIDYQRLSIDHMGSIFEGLLEFKLEKDGSSLKLVNTSGERKNSGSYYTPDYVVDYIVRATLTPVIEGKNNEEILKVKVVDPAMGSAHFLLGTLKFLEESMLKNLNEGDTSLKTLEPSKYRWAVLHNCIYGCDINPLASELGKFSLWMLSASNKDELEPLDDQLFCADSLLDESVWVKFKANNAFDAVVGNPPYVRLQNLESNVISKIKEKYETAGFGNVDLYVPFFELGYKLIGPEGRLGFITPNKFFSADYGAPLRRFIGENKSVSEIYDFGDFQVFQGATTYTCITVLTKKPSKKVLYSQVIGKDGVKVVTIEEQNLASKLGQDPWRFSGDAGAVLEKLKSLPKKLDAVVDKVFQGIATSADSIYILEIEGNGKKGLLKVKSKESGESFEIESAAIMPVLKGANIGRYTQTPHKFAVIFPYKSSAGKVIPFSETEMKDQFPLAYDYLNGFKKRLMARPKCNQKNWWLYPFPKNLSLYCKPKILSQVLSGQGTFSFDEAGKYCFLGGGTAGGNGITLKTGEEHIALSILGILNSPITTAFVRSVSSKFKGGYSVFGKSTISELPIPDLSKISHAKLLSLAGVVKKRISSSDADESIALEAEVNQKVFELYGLNSEEIKQIEKLGLALGSEISVGQPKKRKKAA